MELTKEPNTTGAPGRTSCVSAIPAIASAKSWASVPAMVTGLMAPDRMNGETMQAWLAAAYVRNDASMAPSKVSGALELIRLTITVFRSTNSLPNTISAMRTESAARSPAVTDPMNGLSE